MNALSGLRIECPAELTADDMARATGLIDRCNQNDRLDLPLEVTSESIAGGSVYVLASIGERLVGLSSIYKGGDFEVCIAVDPSDRRQGIGRALLGAVGEEVRRQDRRSFLLVTDEGSVAGRAFVGAMGGRYLSSEYRLVLDPSAVPANRDWPTPVELRQAGTSDLELVVRLLAASFDDDESDVRDRVGHAITLENHRFFIASVDGEPVGNIRTNYYGSTIYVTAFGVIPNRRGRGYGRQMLLRTIDRLIDEKWPTILIEVATDNRNALGLYLSCGFKELTTYGYYTRDL